MAGKCKPNKKQTSHKAAFAAGRILRSKHSSKDVRTAVGGALAQMKPRK